MKEHEQERFAAWRLAERLMDETDSKPGLDPDDDLRMLARQLLRSRELIQVIQPMVKGYAWEHRVGNNQKIAAWVQTYLHGKEEVDNAEPDEGVERDPLFGEAEHFAKKVLGSGALITVNMLGAALKHVSYGRASALIDQLEAAGFISHKDANGRRKVV